MSFGQGFEFLTVGHIHEHFFQCNAGMLSFNIFFFHRSSSPQEIAFLSFEYTQSLVPSIHYRPDCFHFWYFQEQLVECLNCSPSQMLKKKNPIRCTSHHSCCSFPLILFSELVHCWVWSQEEEEKKSLYLLSPSLNVTFSVYVSEGWTNLNFFFISKDFM